MMLAQSSADHAGRLVLVTDAVVASGLGGVYAWNPDGTLASFPGPGYVRNLGYDEEGRLTSIRKGSVLVFEYAYGFDGGRRWRKDLAGNEWEWTPCGVACGSGELVRMTSDLSGGSWAVESTSLPGARTGDLYPLPAPGSPIGRVTETGGAVTAAPLLDAFGVMRSGTLPEDPLRKLYGGSDDEGTKRLQAATALNDPGDYAACVAEQLAKGIPSFLAAIICLPKFKGKPGPQPPPGGDPKPNPGPTPTCPTGTYYQSVTCKCRGGQDSSFSGCVPVGTIMVCDPKTCKVEPMKPASAVAR